MPEYAPHEPANSACLDIWMAAVINQCDLVRRDFAPTAVHDLRVALRRCRSIADGYRAFDPHPAWNLMKDEGKKLFQQLGALRDTHVMLEWIEELSPSHDEAYLILNDYLELQEARLKESASEAVQNFNRKKWNSWISLLSGRVHQVPSESMAFQHLALERWTDAYQMHRLAIRNRSHAAYHRLRIALKKFRYTIENFLPAYHELWGVELKELQNHLGGMNDLSVLWQTGLSIKAIVSEKNRMDWKRRISEERDRRIRDYREKTLGKTSLFTVWRSKLPGSDQMGKAALDRIKTWASFRDPNAPQSRQVAELALKLYDGMESFGLTPKDDLPDARLILEAASLAHDVGRIKVRKKRHHASYRLIKKLEPLIGLSGETLLLTALVARFHRGALPCLDHKDLSKLSDPHRKSIILLAGILRLAKALTGESDSSQRIDCQLSLEKCGEVLHITAPGFSGNDASARYLLESVVRIPIMIH
jgi:CHAD domain-containing protein